MKLIIDTEVIKDLVENEWGYEGIRDDLDELFEKHGTPLDTLKAEKELDEVIERFSHNAEYERTHGNLQGCLEFRQLAEWLKDYKRLLEQEPSEDKYIKVPKKALKYRTAGMVAYNVEWLKNHFDIERAVICGAQEPAYCDRNICLKNEYNGIGCDECEVTKSQEPYDFARWVASEIFDEWEYNKDSFAEIACRKLEKLGIVRAKGDEWELIESEDKE